MSASSAQRIETWRSAGGSGILTIFLRRVPSLSGMKHPKAHRGYLQSPNMDTIVIQLYPVFLPTTRFSTSSHPPNLLVTDALSGHRNSV
jgi:hypothetical protein